MFRVSSEKSLKEPATSTTTSIKGKRQQIWFPELSPYIADIVQFSTTKKMVRHPKKQRQYGSYTGKKFNRHLVQTWNQLSCMFKELKEAVGKGLKEIREMIYEQNASISKDKNSKKEPNRNFWNWKYGNWHEKFSGEVKQMKEQLKTGQLKYWS